MNPNKNQLKQPLMAQYHKTPELSVSSVFKLRPEELELFFLREHQRMPDNAGERRECLIILEKVDWQNGLLKSLATDAETGIIGDVKDIKRRQKFFGENERSLPQVRSFWAVLWDQFDEFYVQVLLVFATVSLLMAIFSGGFKDGKWLESISIYFAVLFAATIQTLCDWGKEKQFLRLRKEVMNEKVTVLRGQYGTSQTVYVADLVVGDIVLINQGDRVPADCLLLEEMDMRVDQKQFFPDADGAESVEKQCSNQSIEQDKVTNPDPILLQDSIVMTGTGKALVLAVGEHALKEKEIKEDLKGDKYALQVEKGETPFQEKLRILAEIVGAYAYTLCIVSVVLFGIVWLLTVMFGSGQLVSAVSLQRLLDLMMTAVALMIVCIPEGMPLVISMAMAFSVDELKSQHLLIKNLDALETSGQLSNIITGKTATLTTGDMTVARLDIAGTCFDAEELNCNIEVRDCLYEAIVLNCDAHMQMKGVNYKPSGSPVEVGLLNFLLAKGVNVQEKLIERESEGVSLKLWIPFSSDRKRMTVAYTLADQPDTVRLVVKGAPEFLVRMCSTKLDSFKQPSGFGGNDDEGAEYLESTVVSQIIRGDQAQYEDENLSGLKAITIAYRDFDREDFDRMLLDFNKFEREEDREQIESQLTLIATIGLMDPLRENIDEAILKLNESKTNVRIVSGDHRESVVLCAQKLGFDNCDQPGICVDSEDLLADLREMQKDAFDEVEGRGATYKFQNKESRQRFKKVKAKLSLVYRATPELKHRLTCALRQSGSMVGVTGEGLSDARALSEADVGFTMGEDGCSAAKDHADVILMDDNFFTVITSIRWGRNIQDNVRKFVQFQMTVNFSCMIFVLTTALFLGHSPFSIVQLLWINLIMDVLAAIAFATEHPSEEIRAQRIKSSDRIITKPMMRAILSQGIYQVVIMFIMLFAGPFMYTVPGTEVAGSDGNNMTYSLYTEELTSNGKPTYRQMHQTLMFQVFVLMNIFNMVNCRILDQMPQDAQIEESTIAEEGEETKSDSREFNIFKRPFSNFWFWIVLFGELNVQFLMVGYGGFFGTLFSTTPLSFGMHITAVCFGLGTWALAALMKITGPKFVNAMPEFGEDEDALKQANSIKDAQFIKKSSGEDGEDEEEDEDGEKDEEQD